MGDLAGTPRLLRRIRCRSGRVGGARVGVVLGGAQAELETVGVDVALGHAHAQLPLDDGDAVLVGQRWAVCAQHVAQLVLLRLLQLRNRAEKCGGGAETPRRSENEWSD